MASRNLSAIRAGFGKGTPLADHCLFETTDIDLARAKVGEKFCSHRLDSRYDGRDFNAAQNRVAGDMLSLNYIRYGSEVSIAPGELQDFYLIQIPIAGGAKIRNGRTCFTADEQAASVLNPDLDTEMTWYAGCEKLLIQIDRIKFHRLAEQYLDRHLSRSVRFEPKIDLSRRHASHWLKLALALFHAAEDHQGSASGGSLSAGIERELMERFIEIQPGSVQHFCRTADGWLPRHLRRADDFIRAHSSECISLDDIADAAGVSNRTLQYAFRQTRGVSPMAALRAERMKCVRHDLLRADGGRSVTEIAMENGISHLGRFPGEYKKMYGELPRETINARRLS